MGNYEYLYPKDFPDNPDERLQYLRPCFDRHTFYLLNNIRKEME